VLLVPPIGGPERKLTETVSPGRHGEWQLGGPFLAWSPDSNWLVIVDSGLFLLSIETGEKRRLTPPPVKRYEPFGDSGPAFSPDGHTLVFSRSVATSTSDLYLLALSDGLKPTGEPKRLTFDNRETSCPVWSLDGREIIFSSGVHGNRASLWRIAVSGAGKPQR
jgi:Tol biopolymer transport system component